MPVLTIEGDSFPNRVVASLYASIPYDSDGGYVGGDNGDGGDYNDNKYHRDSNKYDIRKSNQIPKRDSNHVWNERHDRNYIRYNSDGNNNDNSNNGVNNDDIYNNEIKKGNKTPVRDENHIWSERYDKSYIGHQINRKKLNEVNIISKMLIKRNIKNYENTAINIIKSIKNLNVLKKNLKIIIDKKIGIFDTKKNVQFFLYGMQGISEIKTYRDIHKLELFNKNYSIGKTEKFPHVIVINLEN